MPILANARREKFCQILASGKTATEAYKLAGFKPTRQGASRLAKRSDVRDRVRELQAVAAGAVEVTIESLVAELEVARLLGREKGQAASMVSATLGKARLLGFLDERPQSTVNVTSSLIDGPPRESLAQWQARRARLQRDKDGEPVRDEAGNFVTKTGEAVNARGETYDQWAARRERELAEPPRGFGEAVPPDTKLAAARRERDRLQREIEAAKAKLTDPEAIEPVVPKIRLLS